MIRYKGEILDYYPNTLKPIVIKKSLASVENLSDRKGTSSYTFNVPRTAKNEMLFDFITEDGSLGQAQGDAEILIDLNVYSRGTVYVTGFDDDNFDCIFMGSDLDLISKLQNIPLSNLFDFEDFIVYSDANFKNRISNIGTVAGVGYHINHITPLFANQPPLTIDKWGVFYNLKDLFFKLIESQGYEIESNYFNIDIFDKIDFSTFNGHQAVDYFGANNIVPTQLQDFVNVGTPNGGNTQITPSGIEYRFNATVEKLRVRLIIDYANGTEVERTDFNVIVYGIGIFRPLIISNKSTQSSGGLQEGINYYEFEVEKQFILNEYVAFEHVIYAKSGHTFPLSGFKLNILSCIIETDYLTQGANLWAGNYLGSANQFQFFKGVLNDNNLIFTIEGNKVIIEPKDLCKGVKDLETIQPLQSGIIDITDKIKYEQNIELDYLQAGKVHLKQPVIENEQSKVAKVLPFQEFGSYVYNLNSFNQKNVMVQENYFNTVFNYMDLLINFGVFLKIPDAHTEFFDTWENLLIANSTNELSASVQFINSDATNTLVTAKGLYSRFFRFSNTWDKLFVNTLQNLKNNKIKAVELYDHNGDIMTFRRKYQIRNQVYKLIEYEYDVVNKLVKAKLQIG